jgi:hypothetical protein
LPAESAVTVALAVPLKATVAPLAAEETVPEMVQVAGVALSKNVLETPLALAVRVAVCVVETDATVAVKLALDEPAGTVTLAGTVTAVLLLARVAVNPPVGAEVFRVTVQAADPGPMTLDGLHENPLSVGLTACVIEIVPPLPVVDMPLPVGSDATRPESWTAAVASGAPAAMLNVAVASTPLPMTFVFMPYATQIVLPVLLEHETLLLAALAPAPLATLTLVTSAAG